LSEYHKNYLIEKNVAEEKIVITKQATGYELADIEPKANKIQRIVSISRFVEKKGLDVLIDAAKLLEGEDFVFEIYGFGKLQEDLERQIDDLGCTNISIKGELKPYEVKDVLLNSDLLASPVRIAENGDRDGFPTVIFEAMANGLPVLTTKVSAIPEIIRDYENGFIIEPENPELLADKITEISKLSDKELFEIRKKAQKDVKEISSVEKTMNMYLDTMKEVMCD
jgi:glycosyltransferase involved in cell wall biosynthesis